MRIWIDLANSPHVPFFRALVDRFNAKNHDVVLTARDFAETVALAEAANLNATVIGAHGGGKLSGKAGNLVQRGLALARWARGQQFNIALSHNSYSQILAARVLSLRTITLMDYEHQPANHLAFRFATRIIVPKAFPREALNRFGAASEKVRTYSGTKEDVYLADFRLDPDFQNTLTALGVSASDILVVIRPPASEALYHRFENELFDALLDRLASNPSVKVIFLPRTERQRAQARQFIVPATPLDGPNLIAHSDLVISAGGTMNREAAALGVPAASIYAGEWAAIDEELVTEGRLRRITNLNDVANLPIEKKGAAVPRRFRHVADEVTDLILQP